jgi:hypothetical protein
LFLAGVVELRIPLHTANSQSAERSESFHPEDSAPLTKGRVLPFGSGGRGLRRANFLWWGRGMRRVEDFQEG